MQYDPRTPVAVFLGPSLDVETARGILAANFYPPARMGDVYRLLATGVRTIVIIDGVFHAQTPVWQREILAALKMDIAVVGASSMGALRAAELEPYGMIGRGRVFRWFADGDLDGDDEVALLHADESLKFQGISEPLVNMRHRLSRAYEAGVIDAQQSESLLQELQSRHFGARTIASLLASDAFAQLPDAAQAALKSFFESNHDNLKRDDAVETLRWCKRHLHELHSFRRPTLAACDNIMRPEEIWQRGALSTDGELIPLIRLLRIAARRTDLTRATIAESNRRFFLLDWMAQRGIAASAAELEVFYSHWVGQFVQGEQSQWFAANAVTPDEFRREVLQRATEAWLLRQDPSRFGLSWHDQAEFAVALEQPGRRHNGPPPPEIRQQVMTVCVLNDLARHRGIECPPEVGDHYINDDGQRDAIRQWLDARGTSDGAVHARTLAYWLIDRGPNYFGFDRWSADVALARTLQVKGRIAELVERTKENEDDDVGDILPGNASAGVA